jgi:predicted metal-dependent HD superfamily phosphohydrolase
MRTVVQRQALRADYRTPACRATIGHSMKPPTPMEGEIDPVPSYGPRWESLWRSFGVMDADPALLRELLDRYREPHRKYHTLEHLDACFRHLGTMRRLASHPHEIELALWFHDAIYDIASADNESRSAAWARSVLQSAGVSDSVVQRVDALVMVTCHKALPTTPDQEILIDVDLVILGAPPAVFDAYEVQIMQEYASVPSDKRRAGRRKILQGFLARDRIYHTAHFQATREAQARANLERSIAQLTD